MGQFPAARGSKRREVPLQSTVDDLELTLDGDRTAKFLEVELIAEKVKQGRRNWTLRVRVLPGRADGKFPRPDDPTFEDSAIYLKAHEKGQPPRSIRIPVIGTASDR
jgi:hypothetical protein